MKIDTHVATVWVALLLIFPTGVLVLIRFAQGMPALEGYGDWYAFLASLAGVTTIGGIGKAFSDYRAAAKAAITEPSKDDGP